MAQAIRDELIEELLQGYCSPQDLLGEEGLFSNRARPSLVCVLPRGASPEQRFDITDVPLEVHTNRLARFQAYYSARHDVEGVAIRKGAVDAIIAFAEGGSAAPMWRSAAGGAQAAVLRAAPVSDAVRQATVIAERIAREGGTPLAVAKDERLLGVIHLKDIVKGGIRERFAELRQMGIRTVMITGDNPLTAAAIAAESGVDDFLAQATPENKLELIREEQGKGKLVAMCGDGTNDAPALAQADVGVAMNTGTMAALEAGNMVDLDSNLTKLIEIVAIGKQLLMTRGALTTFSIAKATSRNISRSSRRCSRRSTQSSGSSMSCTFRRRRVPFFRRSSSMR
jgi:soluble P-type ATPase